MLVSPDTTKPLLSPTLPLLLWARRPSAQGAAASSCASGSAASVALHAPRCPEGARSGVNRRGKGSPGTVWSSSSRKWWKERVPFDAPEHRALRRRYHQTAANIRSLFPMKANNGGVCLGLVRRLLPPPAKQALPSEGESVIKGPWKWVVLDGDFATVNKTFRWRCFPVSKSRFL